MDTDCREYKLACADGSEKLIHQLKGLFPKAGYRMTDDGNMPNSAHAPRVVTVSYYFNGGDFLLELTESMGRNGVGAWPDAAEYPWMLWVRALDEKLATLDAIEHKLGELPFSVEPAEPVRNQCDPLEADRICDEWFEAHSEEAVEERDSGAGELDPKLHKKIEKLAGKGNNWLEKSNFVKALDCFETAWSLLPEPKFKWEAASWISVAKADAFFFQGNYEIAYNILRTAITNGVNLNGNPFVQMRRGQCLFEMEEMEGAQKELAAVYMAEGQKIFEDEDPKYLKCAQEVIDA